LDEWFGLWTCGRKNIYIFAYIKNAHGFTSKWGDVSQLISIKFDVLIELIYVINFAKFGVDRSQG